MWLFSFLLSWGLLSSFTLSQDDGVLFTDLDTWEPCLARFASDTSSSIRDDPWAQHPRCRNWRPRLADIPPESNKTPCVFSQASFRDGHGLSLVTTSEVVLDLLEQGALDERDQCEFHGPASSSSFMQGPISHSDSNTPAYEVRSLPGKGEGIVALRRIEKDEVFLLDHPAILATWGLIAQPWSKVQESLLKRAVEQLPENTRKKVLGLSRANLVPGLPLCDLIATNVCALVLGSEAYHIGLFAEFAVSSRLSKFRQGKDVVLMKTTRESTMLVLPSAFKVS